MIRLRQGDITTASVDAIVNAANEGMLGGGGVDGAIHRAAGPELLEACRQVPPVRGGVRCPTGEARITPGFRLRARFVVHTVGPVYRVDSGGDSSRVAALLSAAYVASLELVRSHALSSVAFPAISCGVYGYPLAEAADIAIATCRRYGEGLDIWFYLFGTDTMRAFEQALRA